MGGVAVHKEDLSPTQEKAGCAVSAADDVTEPLPSLYSSMASDGL